MVHFPKDMHLIKAGYYKTLYFRNCMNIQTAQTVRFLLIPHLSFMKKF